jgi:hypothetical protein
MGKINIFTLLTMAVVQFVVGYLWFGSYLFGDVVTIGGHGINFVKLDVISILLLILSSYGLTHIMDKLTSLTHTKNVSGGLKLGLTVGAFGIGFTVMMLLGLMGMGKVSLLVIFTYLVLITILTGIVVVKLRKA